MMMNFRRQPGKSAKLMGWFHCTLVVLFLSHFAGTIVSAQDKEAEKALEERAAGEEATLFPVPNYSGDLWSRSYLTGNWGGLRSKLANNGVQFEAETAHFFQDISGGGVKQTGRYSGVAQIQLKLDSQKMGLWPGGFLFARAEAAFGTPVNPAVGGLSPVNSKPVFTLPARDEMVLPHLFITQFLSEKFLVSLGKLDTTGGDANDFAHGTGDTKFMNLAFSFNPVATLAAPYSALGVALAYLPHKDVVLSFAAFDSEGRPDTAGFDTLFEDGTTLSSEARLTIRPFGLAGHQLVGFEWSNGKYNALNQDPRTLIGNILLGTPLETKKGTWAFYYNFDQYLYTEKGDPKQGFGVFGRAGVADKATNLNHQFYSIGFGGKGTIPTRDNDHWGIGYYYLDYSDSLTGLIRSRLNLKHEQGGELYYNIEVLPWLHLTPDIQIISTTRRRLGTLLSLGNKVDTAVVAGFRVKINF